MLRCQNRFKCFLVSHLTSCRHGSCFKYCCAHICILVHFACVSFYIVYMFQVCKWELGIHLLQKHHTISQNGKGKRQIWNQLFHENTTLADIFCHLELLKTLFPLTFKGPHSTFKPEKHFFFVYRPDTHANTFFKELWGGGLVQWPGLLNWAGILQSPGRRGQ